MLDKEGKESLEISVCREASEKSPRAFWAFRRLGFLQVFCSLYSDSTTNSFFGRTFLVIIFLTLDM